MNKIIKKYLKTSLLLCLPMLLQAQVRFINEGVKVRVNNGIDLRVEGGEMTNKSAGEITNEGNIYLDRNFNQITGATYTGDAASWLWFEGTVSQNIFSDAPLDIARIKVDNGNNLTTNRTVTVKHQIDLNNNGRFTIASNGNLVLLPGATITNYDATHYIVTAGTGYLQQEVGVGNVVFPVGFVHYNPITIRNTGVLDNFRLRATNVVLDQGTTGIPDTLGVVKVSWHLDEEVIGGSITDITVQWLTSQEAPSFDRNYCAVSHWDGTAWDHSMIYGPATNVGLDTWTQTRVGQTTFSPFALEDLTTELPVELLYFNAIRKNISQVQLDWSTASELNNQGFDVERMLESEAEFTKIGWVDGNGTTTNTSYYDWIDDNGYEGISYYRLKQIDFDGTFTYSNIRAVDGWKTQGNAIDIFPNPMNDYINIRLTSDSKEVSLRILDAKGALVVAQTKAVPADKLIVLDDLGYLADGVYMLTVMTDGGEAVTKKIVKKQL